MNFLEKFIQVALNSWLKQIKFKTQKISFFTLKNDKLHKKILAKDRPYNFFFSFCCIA